MPKQTFDYEPIRAAILKRAIIDYAVALRKRNRGQIVALECFFRSWWGQLLSYDNGEYIIKHTRELVEKKKAENSKNILTSKNILV